MISHPIPEDRRYEIEREFCGHDRPRFVLRWCGEFVGSSISYSAMVVRAVGHRAERKGALVIKEVVPPCPD